MDYILITGGCGYIGVHLCKINAKIQHNCI